jgi:hypothetical protein
MTGMHRPGRTVTRSITGRKFMTRTDRHRSRTRLLVAGTTAAVVGVTAGAAGVASAAAALPPLSFVAASTNVVAERYVSGEDVYFYLDLGVNIIPGKDPFEIRAKRTSYKNPIVAKQIVVKNGKKTAVALPAGMVTDFGGFKNFTAITITDTKGAKVKSYQTDFCPNSYNSARTRRDAPALNPYPQGCSAYNPFVLGDVWGIQAGWNSATESMPRSDRFEPPDFDLPAGTYKVTVALNKKYRDHFKIPVAKATLKLNLTVNEIIEEEKPGALAARKAAQARAVQAGVVPPTGHGLHDGEGDANRQLSAYLPEFRAPARRPAAMAAAAVPKGPRPDLRSLPAWGISLGKGEDPDTGVDDGRRYINFGATVWNGGTSPLLVDGFRRTGTELMDAYQYFFDAAGKEVGSVKAGTMEWDKRAGHMHWHFTDFAQYRLLKADKKVAVRSGKESFCLANTDAIDYTLKNAKWRPRNTDLSTSCGGNTAVAVREVLDVGSGDTYDQSRPGQSFDVTDLPNGTYYIEVLANPKKKLAETSTTNNSALRKVVLSGTKTARKLTVPPVYGIQG